MISGHNNTVELTPTSNVGNLIVQGHCNKISTLGPSVTDAVPEPNVNRMMVEGHNNQISNINTMHLGIEGHNN